MLPLCKECEEKDDLIEKFADEFDSENGELLLDSLSNYCQNDKIAAEAARLLEKIQINESMEWTKSNLFLFVWQGIEKNARKMDAKSQAIDFLGGFFGGVVSTYVGHPLDTVKVRMQVIF